MSLGDGGRLADGGSGGSVSEASAEPQTTGAEAPTMVSGASGGTNPPGLGSGGNSSGRGGWAGLIAVIAGLLVLALIACLAIGLVGKDSLQASIATASFGVIGTVVGAYFGAKSSNESTQQAISNTQKAVEAMRAESTKAVSFAAHLDPGQADAAASLYRNLRGGDGGLGEPGGAAAASESGDI
jgi:hypothetical protein